MKLLLIFLATASVAICAVPEAHHHEWRNFKLTHSRLYDSPEEESYRFQVFRDNLKQIEEHNARYEAGLETYELGITKFADMTDEEYVQEISCLDMPSAINASVEEIHEVSGLELPASVDWRTRGAVNAIRNQGGCGSCWAFTSTETLESINFIRTGVMLTLSPQNLVDCAKPYGANGCHGGYMNRAYAYIKDHGIMRDADYPYTAKEGDCKFDSSKSALTVQGSRFVIGEDKLQDAVANIGPIGVGVDAKEWKLYKKGVFSAKQPFLRLTHGVVAVGYGSENGNDYWILRNSYGPNWGENGFIRIARNQNMFGIANAAVYPVL